MCSRHPMTSFEETLEGLRANEVTRAKVDLMGESIEAGDATRLADALTEENTTLTELDAGWNQMGDEGAREMARALGANSSLKILDLRSNWIGDEGAKALAAALARTTTLTRLNLNDNVIGDEGAKRLADALRVNTSLTDVDLSWNKIGREGAEKLEKALRFNLTLEILQLHHNHIGATTDEITSILERNKLVVQHVRSAALLVVGIRSASNHEGMGDLGRLPKDVVLMIAKHV